MAGKRLILVEGTTDRDVLMALSGNLKKEDFRVAGSFSLLCEQIRMVMGENPQSMAVVFDANGEPTAQWRMVRQNILNAYALAFKNISASQRCRLDNLIPKTLTGKTAAGVWVKDYKPWIHGHKSKLGLWMMPDNAKEGELEHFLADMISDDDDCWKDAQEFVGKVSKKRKQLHPRKIFPQQKIKKAEIHAWLAVQERPGKSPAAAVKEGMFGADSTASKNLQNWMEQL